MPSDAIFADSHGSCSMPRKLDLGQMLLGEYFGKEIQCVYVLFCMHPYTLQCCSVEYEFCPSKLFTWFCLQLGNVDVLFQARRWAVSRDGKGQKYLFYDICKFHIWMEIYSHSERC